MFFSLLNRAWPWSMFDLVTLYVLSWPIICNNQLPAISPINIKWEEHQQWLNEKLDTKKPEKIREKLIDDSQLYDLKHRWDGCFEIDCSWIKSRPVLHHACNKKEKNRYFIPTSTIIYDINPTLRGLWNWCRLGGGAFKAPPYKNPFRGHFDPIFPHNFSWGIKIT